MTDSDIKVTLPAHVLKALKQIVAHYYNEELDHCEYSGPEAISHIFHSLNSLREWLDALARYPHTPGPNRGGRHCRPATPKEA